MGRLKWGAGRLAVCAGTGAHETLQSYSRHIHRRSTPNSGRRRRPPRKGLGGVHDLHLLRTAEDRGSLPAAPTGMRWHSAITVCRGVRKGGWRVAADDRGCLVDQFVVVEGLYHE